ncbi:ABC transporter ATP-binding protein, partial [Candidatus Neomarinimicrobiota bacterium]
ILGTLDKPDSGSVIINQTDVSLMKEEKLALLRSCEIGFIFQFHHLLPEFTSFENVMIPTQILGNTDDKMKYAEELFDYIGLRERKEHYPAQLSGGERLRVAVLRALINNPSIIFADEPTGNLDVDNAKKLLQLFTNISKDFGQSLVITTHNEDVALLGDRQFILDHGVLNNKI